MKKLSITLLLPALFVLGNVFSQTDCSTYYPISDGAKFEISLYSKKMKKEGKVVYNVKNDGGDKVLYTMQMYDKKDVLLGDSTYGMQCEEDGVSIDFKSMMSNMTKQFDNMEVDITGNNIYLPNDLKVGKRLADAEMEIAITGAPMNMKSSIKMINRMVLGEEEITTPAGKFPCMIVAYNTVFNMGIKTTGYTKQWLSKNVGMVKTEDYNKEGGKLRSMSLLTSYEN